MSIKADNAEIRPVERKEPSIHEETKEAPMVVFTNAVEITVNAKDQIVGVTNYPKLGLWLDTVNHALQRIRKNSSLSKET